MANKYLILGNGIAGFSAARSIRELAPEAEITMVSAEKESAYLRPLLSKTDLRRFRRGKTHLVPAQWYAENRIEERTGCRAERIDPAAHTVALSDGAVLSYDKCIYALGADCVVPPIPGRDKAGVLTLRSAADLSRLRRAAATAKNAVLIGGGIIGMELAGELCRLGLHCTILEAAPRLMSRQLDPESSALLLEQVRAFSIDCRTGVQVAELTGEDAVTGVKLADGSWFAGELVVLSCGVRPVTAPAAAAGLACGRGIKVDDTLCTSDPDIYAAGDCIEGSVINPGLWKYARLSGELAGRNAVCPQEAQRFVCDSFPVVLTALGTGLFALGVTAESEQVTAVVTRGPKQESAPLFEVNRRSVGGLRYEKRFYRNGSLCGAVLMGDISAMPEILEALEGGKG